MSNSREDSPDWLHSFQVPGYSSLIFSDSSPDQSPLSNNSSHREYPSSKFDDYNDIAMGNQPNVDQLTLERKKIYDLKGNEEYGGDREVAPKVLSQKQKGPHVGHHSILALSSDLEFDPDTGNEGEEKICLSQESGEGKDAVLIRRKGGTTLKQAFEGKSEEEMLNLAGKVTKKEKIFKGNGVHTDIVMERTFEKHIEPHVSTSSVPLILPEKVHRSKALLECEGDSVDLSGDAGAVGRIIIPPTAPEDHEMYLDLKGTIYKAAIVPSRTFCVVSFGQSEAKIEAIMNDFIQLKAQSNVYEAETMVEGTLETFLFVSEDEADQLARSTSHQQDPLEGAEEQSSEKGKGKAEKLPVRARKIGKSGGKTQPARKARKRTAVSKKPKTKK